RGAPRLAWLEWTRATARIWFSHHRTRTFMASDALRSELLAAAKAHTPEHAAEIDLLLAHVATEDLAERDPRDVAGAAASMRHLSAQRLPAETKVRVFTPTLRENGWTSRRTIVEICTADSPFLVDSVTAAIARSGYSLHLLVHPLVEVRR